MGLTSINFRGASISLEDLTKGTINVTKYSFYLKFDYPCSSRTDCTPYEINLPRGQYLFEIYGASGGDVESLGLQGLGGFSRGFYSVKQISSRLFLYLGGEGSPCFNAMCSPFGGFNGGGTAYGDCGGGGGSTDLRTISGTTITSKLTDTRILVAGGGGGGRKPFDNTNQTANGGNGGGSLGGQGKGLDSNKPCIATQSDCTNGSGTKSDGKLWKGADGELWGASNGGGGGGGGYYGGGTCADCSGSGGSGYFSPTFIVNGKTSESNHKGNGTALIYFFPSLTLHKRITCFPFYAFFVIFLCK